MALSEREVCPWFHLELKLHHVEEKWEATIKEDEDSYTLKGILDSVVEKKCNGKLMVSGPLIHVYLKELGTIMLHKLCRGKMTGIQSGNAIWIPWQVMVNLMKLAQGYGATITSECKTIKKKYLLYLSTVKCVEINFGILRDWEKNALENKLHQRLQWFIYVCRFQQSGYYKYVTNGNDIPHENTESIVILLYSKV